MKAVRITSVSSLLLAMVLVTGCSSPSLTGDTYSRSEARQTQRVNYGVIVNARPVVIEGESSVGGKVAGAVMGGLLGNQIGSGSGNTIATAAGVIAGSTAASSMQESASRAQGLELTIDLENGQTISVVQEVEHLEQFMAGDRVQISGNGRNTRVSRV